MVNLPDFRHGEGNNPHRTAGFSMPCPAKNAGASLTLDSGHGGGVSRWYSKCSSHGAMALATCVATIVEKRRPLHVDTMIPDPLFTSTHAITIEAAPEQVWPWIAQMGAGRAGWYSGDAIDNGGMPSSSLPLRTPDSSSNSSTVCSP